MRLTETQIQTLLTQPVNTDKLQSAVRQEERLVFHTEQVQSTSQLNSAYKRWISWVEDILPVDKHDRFKSLITVPVTTNKQVQSIFTELRKVFESQDGVKKVQFIDPSLLQDFADYDSEVNISSFMKTKGWETIKTGISSFLVVDMPAQQVTSRPVPYPIVIPACNIFTCEFDEEEKLEYLFYWLVTAEGKKQICVLDDEFYRLYAFPENGAEWVQILQSPHSLFDGAGNVIDGPGYVPARGIWKTASKASKYVDKIGPITNVLGDLDYYLFKDISFKYLGLYGDYPIIFTFETKCDYKNDQGMMCEGTKVERIIENGDQSKSVWEDCPRCSARKNIGAGSTGTIKAPTMKDEVNLMDKPIHIAEIGNEKLEWGMKNLDAMEDDIFITCVGVDLEPTTMAQNELQVQRSFESRQNVLERVAANIDEVERFLYNTCCYLRYGRRYFLGAVVSSGSMFYLQKIADIDKRYADAKNSGKPMYELAEIRGQANKTENKNNPDALRRVELLSQLEPWPDLGLAQIQTLGLQNMDTVSFAIKVNFSAFIDRFERENINIVEFGSNNLTLAQKITVINSKLQDYGKEIIANSIPQPVAPGNEGAPTRPN